MKIIYILVVILLLVLFNHPINTYNVSYLNESHAPIEQFCSDNNMSTINGTLVTSWGCEDNNGEIHYFDVRYQKGYWYIGNKTYLAEFK